MTEVAQATVTIIPNMKGSQAKIAKDLGANIEPAGESVGESFGKKMLSGLAGLGIAAAVGKVIKDSLDEGGKLQQSLGGIETLFKDNADVVKGYASKAYKTAGLSANEYMENVTSFSAALIKSMNGDTKAAAELANTAMIDMADNANKMGTDMSAIQNAYQGFAKGNYTMLDNLKLGYGGTKTEMERLLADATELSGVEYNIDNLSDVYEAIHVIQEDLDITGTTAKEASETFSGSFASMKAAATDLLGNLALGNDVSPQLEALGDSVKTFVVGNLLPMIGNVVQQIPSIIAAIPGFVADLFPDLVSGVVNLVAGLAKGIVDNIPAFISGIGQLLAAIPEAFTNINWGSVGSTLLEGLKSSINSIWDSIVSLFSVTFGIELPDWGTVQQDISDLWESVKSGITGFFTTAFDIIMADDMTVTEKISALWDLVNASIGDFFKAVFDVAMPAVETVVSAISGWWEENIWPSIQDFFKATFNVELPSWSTIAQTISEGWAKIQTDIEGLFEVLFGVEMPSFSDIVSAITTLWGDVCDGIADFFKVTFNITIPSYGSIKESVEDLWHNFRSGIAGYFKKAFSVTLPSWSDIQSSIKVGWDEVKKGLGDVFSWIFSLEMPDLSGVIQGLKDWWGNIVDGIGSFFTLDWVLGDHDLTEDQKTLGQQINELRNGNQKYEVKGDQVTIDSKAIQDALNNANLTLSDVDTSSIDKAKEAVTNAVAAMERAFAAMRLTIPTVESSSMQAASQVISSWRDTYKRLMNFSWSLPALHGKLPVISVNMQTAASSDGKTHVSYPNFNVSGYKWFAKGAVFNEPTVIGIGDSKGPEAAVPLDMMWRQLGKEFDEHLGHGATVTNYFTVNGADSPEEFADRVARQLKLQLRMA